MTLRQMLKSKDPDLALAHIDALDLAPADAIEAFPASRPDLLGLVLAVLDPVEGARIADLCIEEATKIAGGAPVVGWSLDGAVADKIRAAHFAILQLREHQDAARAARERAIAAGDSRDGADRLAARVAHESAAAGIMSIIRREGVVLLKAVMT